MPVSRFLAQSTAIAVVLVLAAANGEDPAAAQALASPFTTGYRYDVAGRLVGMIGPDDSVGTVAYPAERLTYGAKGLLIRVESGWLAAWQSETVAPSAWTGFSIGSIVEFSYDSLGRKIQERRLAGGIVKLLTEFEYDAHDRLTCSALRMNEPSFGSPPVAGCTPRTPGPSGPDRITRTSYDNRDRVTQIEKGVWTNVAQIYAAYTYNAGDRPLTVIDANGNKAELSYDGFERQTRWTFPSESATGQINPLDYERYEYDLNGNRTLFQKRDESILTFAYDALNRMTAKFVPERSGLSPTHTRDVHYAYDLRGLQTRARFDNRLTGEGIDSGYDGFGRLASSTTNMSTATMGGASRTLIYQSDADGNRTRITHPPAIVPTHPHLGPLTFYYNYQYDGLDRPMGITNAGGSSVAGWTYNAFGRLETIARPGAPSSVYGYDSLSRTSSIAHDLAGPAFDLTLTFQYNPANQIASRTSSNEAYDNATAYNVSRPYAAKGSTNICRPERHSSITTATATSSPTGRPTSSTTSRTGWSRHREPGTRPWSTTRSGGCSRCRAALPGRSSSSTTATRWWPNIAAPRPARTSTSTAPGSTGQWSGTTAAAAGGASTPTIRARSSPSPTRPTPGWRSTATMPGASPIRPMPAGSNIPARSGCPSSACIITRRGSTRRRWADSCRRTRSAMRTR
ncbi:MAG TPA: hypothetical protein VEA60_06815 [Allosphingosinicella sp.]|nr:hypothetical protein [Allosphingosinicella sp.]